MHPATTNDVIPGAATTMNVDREAAHFIAGHLSRDAATDERIVARREPSGLTPSNPDGKLRPLMNEGRVSIHAASAIAMTVLGLACIPTAPRPDGGIVPAPTFEVRLGDCATAEQGLEFAPFMISDFEAGLGQYAY